MRPGDARAVPRTTVRRDKPPCRAVAGPRGEKTTCPVPQHAPGLAWRHCWPVSAVWRCESWDVPGETRATQAADTNRYIHWPQWSVCLFAVAAIPPATSALHYADSRAPGHTLAIN